MELLKLATKIFLKNPQIRRCDLKPGTVQLGMAQLMPGYNNDLDIQGLANQLLNMGFVRHVESWLSDDKNLPLSPKQAMDILGEEKVLKFSQLLRMEISMAAQGLARVIPLVIDQQSDNGVLFTKPLNRNPFIKFFEKRLGAA